MATFYVYVLHFDRPLADHAWHYVGATDNLLRRLKEHATGKGAKITAACRLQGIGWRVASVFTMKHRCHFLCERRVKRYHQTDMFCGVCQQDEHKCIPGSTAIDLSLLGIPLTSAALAAAADPEDLECTDVPF